MKEGNRDFKGIWIPKQIWLSNDLTLQEKIFLVEIDSLDNCEGCFARNIYFAKFFGLSVRRVQTIISSLVNKGYISLELIYKAGTKEVEKRVMKIISPLPRSNIHDPHEGKFQTPRSDVREGHEGIFVDNNTVNNTINNTSNKRVKKHTYLEFVKLTKDEYKKLIERLGQHSTDDYIERLNNYIGSKGKRYKSHYHTILAWNRRDVSNGQHKGSNNKGNEQGKTQPRTSKSMGEDGYNTTDAADKVIERYGDGIDTSDLEDLPF